jgi:hypothetical protein
VNENTSIMNQMQTSISNLANAAAVVALVSSNNGGQQQLVQVPGNHTNNSNNNLIDLQLSEGKEFFVKLNFR